MDRIIAVNSNCYHGYGVDDALEGIAKAGFKYVELTATKGWTEHVFYDMTFEELHRIKSKMDDLGLIPFALSGHCNLMDEKRLNDFILNIKLAAFFGSDYIVSSVGEAHLEDATKTSNELVAKNVKAIIPYLEEYDIKMVIETHGEHSLGAVVKDIVDRVGSERVGINYDTANVLFYADVMPEEDIKTCMEKVKYMHIKDKAGANNEWDFPALGKGHIDFDSLFAELEKANNNCPFSIEIEFTADGAKDVAEVNEAVEESAKFLKEKGFSL